MNLNDWSIFRVYVFLLLAGLLLATPDVACGQEAERRKDATPAQPASPPATTPADNPTYLETVTVSATLNPATLRETPGTVSVIDSTVVARRLIENTADLVKFEPGVYIETNLTRIGLNGFNIRGIGGNRVMTQVDGVETAEQFDFGPFNVHQFALDLDTLKTAEIMRSAGSAIYGSDALGGVVSFYTKDPVDYLGRQRFQLAGKTSFDGRSGDTSGNAVVAGAGTRVQGSMFVSYVTGHEPGNQGTVRTESATRTALNPQDRQGLQALGKMTVNVADGNLLRAAIEVADTDVDTRAFSSRGAAVSDITSHDTMRRGRVSLDQSLVGRLGLHLLSWSLYTQRSSSNQVVDEARTAAGPTPALNRHGTLEYSQASYGGTLQGRKAYTRNQQTTLLTFGTSIKHHRFDMLRDRVDVNAQTGATVPAVNLILPSKYFPESAVTEAGAYAQGELRLGRLLLVPGLRFDRFSLNADGDDQVFLATLSPAPVDFSAGAVSSKLGASFRVSDAVTVHAQYAGGFRAPPYSAVNSGFTNLQGGYTSIPNTELDPESSDNLEAGVRFSAGAVSFGATVFSNHYDDFINQVARGVNPANGLLEYQYQNLAEVEIRGLELRGEAHVTQRLLVRASWAAIRGNDVSGAADVPLNTIAPDQGSVGLSYVGPADRWGSDVSLRAARGQAQATAGSGLFAPEGFGVVDLTGWATLTRRVVLRAGVLNLTDAKYFEWTNVRGRPAGDPVIDRYSSPGISGLISLSYGW